TAKHSDSDCLAEIVLCSVAKRRNHLTLPKEVRELPAGVRRQLHEGAICDNNSVGITVRVSSNCSNGTRDAQRLKRTEGAGSVRRGWFNLTDRAPGSGICDHVAPEQFFCFEMAIGANALFRLNYLG